MVPRALLCCALLLVPAIAQESKVAPSETRSAEEIDKSITLWHDRAIAFTDAALDDQWRLPSPLPVLQARLAEAWWKADVLRAKSWLQSAVNDVTFEHKSESEKERTLHLQAAEVVFQVCERLKLDNYAQQVLNYLMAEAKRGGAASGQGIASTAGTVMIAATDAALTDPDRALALGSKLVDLHSGVYVLNVVESIRIKRPEQADQLFEKALISATNSADYSSIYTLMQYPFPYFNNPGPDVSDGVKAFTANAIGSFLANSPSDEAQQTAYCREAPRTAEHMLPLLAAAQQGVIQAAIQTCRSSMPEEDPDKSGDVGPEDCKTADECLRLADAAKSDERRARLKEHAANSAQSEQDPVRALEILNSLTSEEKQWAPNWQSTYGYLCDQAMRKLYARNDSHTIQSLIDRAPNELRAQVILSLVSVPEVRKDQPFEATLLTEARRALEKFPSENPYTYLSLLNGFVDAVPNDALPVFGFVTSALNHVPHADLDTGDEDKKKNGDKERPRFHWQKLGWMIEPVGFNAALLEQDDAYVVAAIKALDDVETRNAFRLTCLRYSLKRIQQEQKAKEQLLQEGPKAKHGSEKH